ncbi:hypothetical protein AYI69_g4028 [Smittium culicis]|uniref:Uncharacterized protein n=1 Tax=Smittium culicis TaxID=133412 RepID=A0A1R1YH91_9FUNG|nr:hypothetical protein AYI69_g4028 [Smittium culicis]
MVERGHQPIIDALSKYCEENYSDWELMLPKVLWADRVTVKRTTGYSPYELVYGRECLLPVEYNYSTWFTLPWKESMTTEELLVIRMKQLSEKEEFLKEASKGIINSRNKAKEYFESNHRIRSEILKPGTLVLLHNTHLLKSTANKLRNRWRGPYKILESRKNGSYILAELNGVKLRNTQPGARIKEFFQNIGRNYLNWEECGSSDSELSYHEEYDNYDE